MSTRSRITEEADRLFYERGYAHTSFADIAAAVALSRGNFYHHFKTKDDILDAVLDRRLQQTRGMLATWDVEAPTPAARVGRFIHMMAMNSVRIRRHGCPVGSLCTELGKLAHPALPHAKLLLTLFRTWLATQFGQMGHPRHADTLAMHLLARSQGIATLASAFDDDRFIHQEVEQLLRWLHDLASSSTSQGD
jgi:AcrR family transcriptional regulator